MPVYCWAPACSHNNMGSKCSFFRFPKKMKDYQKWLKLLKRNGDPGIGDRVCSCHFKDGKKENYPEIVAGNEGKLFPEHYLSPESKPRSHLNPTKKACLSFEEPQPSTSCVTHEPENEELEVDPSSAITSESVLSRSSYVMLEAENTLLKADIERKEKMGKFLQSKMSYVNISGSNKLVLEYTGLPTADIFENLYTLIKDAGISYYLKWTVQKMDRIDQLLMTLMKLRQNFTHTDLAFRFNVSKGTVTNVITTFIHLLHEVLYKDFMATIPSREKNRCCLPNCCSTFTNCRIIIDCTDIACTVPRHSMKNQRLTYSAYKHRNTFKGLVGVAPNGVVTFISSLYPGSTSDKYVVKHCGLLKYLQPGDLILADKGFLIRDILPNGVSLNIPPFLATAQFTPQQIEQTKRIPKARIHVERAIRRIKSFQIINNVPERLFNYISVVFQTVGALTNLQYPLIREVADFFVDKEA